MLVPVVLNSGGAKHTSSIVPTHCAKAEQLLTFLSGLLDPGSWIASCRGKKCIFFPPFAPKIILHYFLDHSLD